MLDKTCGPFPCLWSFRRLCEFDIHEVLIMSGAPNGNGNLLKIRSHSFWAAFKVVRLIALNTPSVTAVFTCPEVTMSLPAVGSRRLISFPLTSLQEMDGDALLLCLKTHSMAATPHPELVFLLTLRLEFKTKHTF